MACRYNGSAIDRQASVEALHQFFPCPSASVLLDVISGLFDYMRNEYRNPRQIKTDGGKLADYTLLLFEEKVKAIFNKAVRSDLIASNPIHDLTKGERFHAPDKHREFLTPEELTRFLSVETATYNERQVQLY